MQELSGKLSAIADKVGGDEAICVAILGLGSVGHYFLDYLLADADPRIKVCVVGRDRDKMLRSTNVSRIAASIRGRLASEVTLIEADFASVESTEAAIRRAAPDFIVNSSRAFSGVKYGSLSWNAIRAYGLWAPLSVRFIKNIMRAYERSGSGAVVINTSYSDVTNAWLRTAGYRSPDFGSGNLNHLVPRISMAVGGLLERPLPAGLSGIDVTLATSHYHDVLISREGVTGGVDPLLDVRENGEQVDIDHAEIYKRCAIDMPVDHKRNMMNASSNYEIVRKILAAVTGAAQKFHSPGVDGLVGGYPVVVHRNEGSGAGMFCGVDESRFSLHQMQENNRRSIYCDGIADVVDGELFYTPEMGRAVGRAFGFDLPERVRLEDSDSVASELVDRVIRRV